MTVRPVRVVLAAAAAVVGCVLAGCSSSKGSEPPGSTGPATGPSGSATSSGAAGGIDVLIAASDIPAAGLTLLGTRNVVDKTGVAGLFANADRTRTLGDTIVVLPTSAGALAALKAAEASVSGQLTAAQELGTGDAGKIYKGAASGGTRDRVLVVFAEGRAFVTLTFDGAKGNGAPDSVIAQVVKAQDDKIKANLPS